MSEIDPEQAFKEIVQHERHAEMLRIATPPWDIAADDGIPGLPTQRQHLSQEMAQVACGTLLREAAFKDILFVPTFSTIINTVRGQIKILPKAPRNTTTLINDAAFLIGHFPDPGDTLQLREQMEHNAEKRGDHTMHRKFVLTADVMRRALSAPVADQLVSYAQASLSPYRRHDAFERVLDVVYGDRYSFWRAMLDRA